MGKEYRVYGPPGCGKTTYIASRTHEFAERFGEDQVSICSLTNSAVREAIGRDLPLVSENVATLHARCKRALNAPPPAESRVEEFIAEYPKFDNEEILPLALRRRRRREDEEPETTDEVAIGGSREPTLYEKMQINRQQMLPLHEWVDDVRSFYLCWRDWMEQTHTLDFTGWLETALQESALPAQQAVFIDEAQDHTPLQLEVIRNWQAKHRILVGDDDQNLYEWSGAIPDRFFLPELPSEREKVLSQSYRVPAAIHARAQNWIRKLSRRRQKEYSPRDAQGAVYEGLDAYGLWEAEDGGLPAGIHYSDPGETHMILTSAGYFLDPVLEALKSRRVPFHNPYRRTNAKWNPLDRLGGILDNFLKPSWTGEEAYSWLKVLRSRDVYQRGRRKACLEWLRDDPQQQIYLEDLHPYLLPSTLDCIEREDLSLFSRRRKGEAGNWPYVLSLYQRPPEERIPHVIVGTIHSVKGGEANHVYLMPDLSPAASAEYMGPRRDRVIRLMYVGMTRASCTLNLGRQSGRLAVSW